MATIIIGNCAGHHFWKDGTAITVAYHATRIDDTGRKIGTGLFFKKKWLADREAFNSRPQDGWAYEHWFEWKETQ